MIYQLKITLEHTGVWRRLLVDEEMTFYQLHHLLQMAFDWDDYHLHCFTVKDVPRNKLEEKESFDIAGYPRPSEATIGNPEYDEGWTPLYFDEREEIVSDWLFVEKDSCLYTYDFGDNWVHRIVLEKLIAPSADMQYPVCIKAVKEAPEEDSGGIWGEEVEESDGAVIMKQINQRIRENSFPLTGADFAMRAQEAIDEAALWHKLFSLAAQFNKLQPWMWMSDIDLFAVADEKSGEVGYCSVLGEGQELFGLAVYKGEEGLRALLQIMSGELKEADAAFVQKSLLLSFEDRKDLSADEYELIQLTGMKFRGRKAWPSFRSYEPGYYPWHLSEAEADFLIRVLEQALIVLERVRKEPHILNSGDDSRIFTRSSTIEGDRTLWKDSWLNIEPPASSSQVCESVISDIQQAQIKKNYKQDSAVWEYGLFYGPTPVQEEEDERPYYPRFHMCLDQRSGQVLTYDLVGPEDDLNHHLQHHLVSSVEAVGSIPSRIWVENDQAYGVLLKLCQRLGIQLERVNKLPVMEHVKESMLSMGVL
ncbi:plasmid pRiA4b ORF-3 family protein [Paenibacillus sp. J2TS4]|uniref:plasmid pRiA4b ORF-3 family protein n=1 Tax=Paenibacillus sp. J2TS4 TaxID=2807194 RepID=UPI001B11783F|nr:plasmid pRiA4b ORF-3 family protein [Paenibacillus sp. J2TS4]GIP35133.1 hypothetical protein J2TS4_43430 [Paenibacillus sp. J2TS4]